MLQRLVCGAEETSSVLVEGCGLLAGGQELLCCVAAAADHRVLLSCGSRLTAPHFDSIIDLSDPLGWDSPPVKFPHFVVDLIEKKKKGRLVVVVDSLSALLTFYPPPQVFRLLARLQQDCVRVVALVQTGSLPAHLLEAARHAFNTSLRLQQPGDQKSQQCSVYHRKAGGRLVLSKESYTITDDGKVEVTQLASTEQKRSQEKQQEEEEDSAGQVSVDKLTTFRLSLKDNEREAKDSLVLPFHEASGRKKEGATIEYQPDSGDDWDDEDPDDDLDF